MGTITYALDPSYVGVFAGGTIRVDDGRTINVGTLLGGPPFAGTIDADDQDYALLGALDAYRPPLYRTGTNPAGAPSVPYARFPVQAVRTVAGPPTSGTYSASDIAIDQAGSRYICIVGGSPGTWINDAQERGYAEYSALAIAQTTAAGRTDYTGLASITFNVYAGETMYVVGRVAQVKGGAAAASGTLYITDAAGTITGFGNSAESRGVNSPMGELRAVERIITPGAYTRKLQIQAFGATITFGVSASPTQATSIRASKVVQ